MQKVMAGFDNFFNHKLRKQNSIEESKDSALESNDVVYMNK